MTHRRKAKLLVQPMSIESAEHKPSESSQFGMVDDRLHERLRNPAAPKLGDHEHISQIGKHRPVGNDARKCDLPPTLVGRETQGVLNRALNRVATATSRPVRGAQEIVNERHIDSASIA